MSDDSKPLTPSKKPPLAERRSDATEIEAFLSQARAMATPGKANGRLILALDATMSRQPTWDLACELQGQMFDAVGKTALDPAANIGVGATILRDCINRRGSIDGGLACYVGATGPDDNGYGAKVQAERRRLALASGIALARD